MTERFLLFESEWGTAGIAQVFTEYKKLCAHKPDCKPDWDGIPHKEVR